MPIEVQHHTREREYHAWRPEFNAELKHSPRRPTSPDALDEISREIFFSKDIAVSGQGGTAASEKYPGGSPFTCRGEGKRKIGNPIHNVPLHPPLTKQDKGILDAWFYSCKAEKCPENPPSSTQRREEKVGNPTKSTHKPPLSQNPRESLEFEFFALSTSDMVQPPPDF